MVLSNRRPLRRTRDTAEDWVAKDKPFKEIKHIQVSALGARGIVTTPTRLQPVYEEYSVLPAWEVNPT